MRRLAAFAILLAGCGAGQKKKVSAAPAATGNEELHIPSIDPARCDPKGKTVRLFDVNRDGKPDLWKLYAAPAQGGASAEVLVCKQVDLNYDGKKDYVGVVDDGGHIVVEEWDFDFDGRFDARVHFDPKTGRKVLIERISGFGDRPDVWEKYGPDGKLVERRRDRNGDGKPDVWEQWRAGDLEAILYDDDFDGTVDRKVAAHPERELAGEPPAPAADRPAAAAARTSVPAAEAPGPAAEKAAGKGKPR